MRLWPIMAILLAACGCAGLHGLPPAGTTSSQQAPQRRTERPPRPRIVWRPIPFGPTRRAQTAAYAARHYGIHTWRLRHPHVIVEHYTASQTFASAYATFASDAPDSELHELPGTCAHFVIDRDGTIYQLVPLDTICRHTVGLNWTAIGIEHVGTSDAEILHDRRPDAGLAGAHRVACLALSHPAAKRDRP